MDLYITLYFVDRLRNIQHYNKKIEGPMNSPLWKVISTPPRLIGNLLVIESLMFEVVLNNYMFCKPTNQHIVNRRSNCI
jgi:hypothetical protein